MVAPFVIEWWPLAFFQAMEQEWMDKMKLVEAANEMEAEKKQQIILNLERFGGFERCLPINIFIHFSLLENSNEESKLIKEHLCNDLNMLAKVKL